MAAPAGRPKLAPIFTKLYHPASPRARVQAAEFGAESARADEEVDNDALHKRPRALDRISTLPLEVFLHICALSSPGTLLELSRTCTSFRRTLFHKGAERVWVAARKHVGWPDLSAGNLTDAHRRYSEHAFFFLPAVLKMDKSVSTMLGSTWPKDTDLSGAVTASSQLIPPLYAERRDDEAILAHEKVLKRRFEAEAERKREARLRECDRVVSEQWYEWPDLTLEEIMADLDSEDEEGLLRSGGQPDWFHVLYDGDLPSPVFRQDATHFEMLERQAALAMFFSLGTPLQDSEWDDVKHWLFTEADKVQQERDAEETRNRETAEIQAPIKPLYDEVLKALSNSDHRLVPTFSSFCYFPTVRPLWGRALRETPATQSRWSPILATVVEEVIRTIRRTEIELFSQVARNLSTDGVDLPDSVKKAIAAEFLPHHHYPSNAIPPLHAALPRATLFNIFNRVTALFLCKACGVMFHYPHILTHLRHEHDDAVISTCQPACKEFRRVVRSMLEEADLSEATTTSADLEALGPVFDIEEWTRDWDLEIHAQQTWSTVTSRFDGHNVESISIRP
ncbi:F-box protein [Rhodotorula paludigena]|uniref:F-box protein n=1 Tax=Rhodotorula paludigena TaxID=86838 RepID=UPI00316EFD4A